MLFISVLEVWRAYLWDVGRKSVNIALWLQEQHSHSIFWGKTQKFCVELENKKWGKEASRGTETSVQPAFIMSSHLSFYYCALWPLCLDISCWNCPASSEKQNLCTPNDELGKRKKPSSSLSVIINFSPVFKTFKELLIWKDGLSYQPNLSASPNQHAYFSISEFLFALKTELCIDAGFTNAGYIFLFCCLISSVFKNIFSPVLGVDFCQLNFNESCVNILCHFLKLVQVFVVNVYHRYN